MVIDAHTHAFPDSLAARAVPALEAEAEWKARLDGRISSLIASMDRAGVAASVVCPIATKPEQAEGILRWCLQIRSDRIVPLASVHPADPQRMAWPRRIAEAHLAGIKLHPMYQDFAADSPAALELYRACAEHGLIVLIHCGRDTAYPPDDDRADPARIARALAAVPALRLIATHMGGWRMWGQAEAELVGADCWMETSFSLSELPPERAVAMMRRHGIGRVMFGTDSPWADQAEEIARVRSLPLTGDEIQRILHANAAELLGLAGG